MSVNGINPYTVNTFLGTGSTFAGMQNSFDPSSTTGDTKKLSNTLQNEMQQLETLVLEMLMMLLRELEQGNPGSSGQGHPNSKSHSHPSSKHDSHPTSKHDSHPTSNCHSGMPPGWQSSPGSSGSPGSSHDNSQPNSSGGPASGSGGPIGNAGNGTDQKYNVVNNTSHGEYFTYTDRSGGSATIFLAQGQSGTIYASSSAIGDRITADGATLNPATQNDGQGGQELFENGASPNGTQNPDISAVDGRVDGNGETISMVVTLPDGRTAGDGQQQIHEYRYSTDDAGSMGLANSSESEMTLTVT